jgi:hypothetical protein
MQHRIAVLLFLLAISLPLSAQWFDWNIPGIPRNAEVVDGHLSLRDSAIVI